ncbi:MAG: hypothetical protein F4X38_09430 [Acidimicrobiaceae bacterium]|nr:hypothetical protein [Acidimicrobiaceae bacterium]
MAVTHAQRTSMYSTLAEVMGQDDAETLMEHLPPSGWDNVATKEDLRAGFAEVNAAMATGFAQATTERAEIKVQMATELAEIKVQMATELAEIVRRQAWHLYIIVSTIVLATVSIWIALLTQPGAGG